MNVLIIEDDENKRNQICCFIQDRFSDPTICVAKSLHSGLKGIINGDYDLILLDMTLPTFDINVDEHGGRPRAYGGKEILSQMNRRGIVVPVVVVTQFDRFGQGIDLITLNELNRQLHTAYPNTYMGAVYYNAALEGWKDTLYKLIVNILQNRTSI